MSGGGTTVEDRAALYAEYAEGATEQAAMAIAASRTFDVGIRHDLGGACTEAAPCRLCYYDAAAAVAAVLVYFDGRRLDDSAGI
jgi:hypothetical protein